MLRGFVTADLSNGINIIEKDGRSIVESFDSSYNNAYLSWDSYLNSSEEDLRFYLGDQYSSEEKNKLFDEGRNAFVFNRIRRNINLITGYQRKNRLSSVVLPFENNDQQVADQRTQVLMHVMNKANGYNNISDCFGGALKTGFNLCSLWKDFRDDPINGDIRMGRVPYNGFIVDPYFTKLDFSDCSYILMRKYLSIDECASIMPKHKKEIEELGAYGWERDDKFTWLPYQRQPSGDKMMAYNEYWTMGWERVPIIVDEETGEYTEFDVPKEMRDWYLSMYPQLKVSTKQKQYVKRHIIINDVYFMTKKNPYGLNEYPFVPFMAVFEPESDLWDLKVQSLIRCMKDPQKESNRRRSQMIDLVDSQLNSGWIADEDSVVNPHALFKSGQGNVIWRKTKAKPKALEKIPPAQIPPSMFQLQQTFDNDMVEIAGINDAAFGAPDSGNESGIMMMLRQGAALTNLQDLFDNLRLSQKYISEKILKMTQSWRPAKIKRILNEKPSPAYYDYESIKYDISIQEGILTGTQKQMYFRQLLDLQQAGAPVTGTMLAEAAPIQGKTEYLEQIKQMEQQQAQEQQRQQAIQDQLLESQMEQAKANAISSLSAASERRARSHSNLALSAERVSESEQNRSQAALDRAKTLTEIQSLETDQLIKILQVSRMLQQEEVGDREAIAGKVQLQSELINQDVQQDAQEDLTQSDQKNNQEEVLQ